MTGVYHELNSGSSPPALGFGETCLAALQRGGKLGQLSGALTRVRTCGWEPSVPWAGSWDLGRREVFQCPWRCVRVSSRVYAPLPHASAYLPLRGGHPSTSPSLSELSASFCHQGARKPTYACMCHAWTYLSACAGTGAPRQRDTQIHAAANFIS